MPKPKETQTTIKIRRAPKFLPFLITGAVLGVITALILNFSTAGNAPDATPILGYLLGWCTVLGAAVGIVAAVAIDFVTTRRSKEVVATKLEQ